MEELKSLLEAADVDMSIGLAQAQKMVKEKPPLYTIYIFNLYYTSYFFRFLVL